MKHAYWWSRFYFAVFVLWSCLLAVFSSDAVMSFIRSSATLFPIGILFTISVFLAIINGLIWPVFGNPIIVAAFLYLLQNSTQTVNMRVKVWKQIVLYIGLFQLVVYVLGLGLLPEGIRELIVIMAGVGLLISERFAKSNLMRSDTK